MSRRLALSTLALVVSALAIWIVVSPNARITDGLRPMDPESEQSNQLAPTSSPNLPNDAPIDADPEHAPKSADKLTSSTEPEDEDEDEVFSHLPPREAALRLHVCAVRASTRLIELSRSQMDATPDQISPAEQRSRAARQYLDGLCSEAYQLSIEAKQRAMATVTARALESIDPADRLLGTQLRAAD